MTAPQELPSFWRLVLAPVEAVRCRLQKPDRSLVWASCLVLLALSVIGYAATLRVTGPVLSWDGKDYAQLARQLARGEGRTTKVLYPEYMDEIERHGPLAGRWADVVRPPLPVFAMASFFKLFGYSDLAAVLWAGGFYILSAPVLFLAAFPLFGYRPAFLAGLVFLLSRCGLVYARAGLTESAAIFFLILVFWNVASERNGMHWPLLAGICMGACWMARPVATVWLVAVAPFVARDPRRPTWMRAVIRLAVTFAGFLLVMLFSRYAFHWSGTRALIALNLAYRVGPVEEAMQSMPRFFLSHIGGMLFKFVHEISRPLVYFFQIGGMGLFSALIPFGLLYDSRPSRGRAFLLTIFVLNSVCLAFLTAGDAFAGPLRYFDVLAPLGLPWAVMFLLNRNAALSAPKRMVFYALLLLYLAGSAVQSVRDPFAKPVAWPMYKAMSSLVSDTEVIAVTSDAEPPAIAWYSDRRTLAIQDATDQRVASAVGKGIPVNWFFATDRESPPAGFAPVRTFPGGLVLYHRQS